MIIIWSFTEVTLLKALTAELSSFVLLHWYSSCVIPGVTSPCFKRCGWVCAAGWPNHLTHLWQKVTPAKMKRKTFKLNFFKKGGSGGGGGGGGHELCLLWFLSHYHGMLVMNVSSAYDVYCTQDYFYHGSKLLNPDQTATNGAVWSGFILFVVMIGKHNT